MTKNKKIFISILIMIIVMIGVFSLILDFTRFASLHNYDDMFSSRFIKRIIVLLSVVIVFAAGKDSYHPKDYKQMKMIFLVICFGEIAFLLEHTFIGVLLFSMCHFLLILRNGKGIKNKIINLDVNLKKKLSMSALYIGLIFIVLITLFYPVLRIYGLLAASYFYLALLSISFWVGLAAYLLKLFPKINAQMIALGTAGFYCCDLLVGMEILIQDSYLWLLVNSAVWIFYTPAVLFLALSCYKYHE